MSDHVGYGFPAKDGTNKIIVEKSSTGSSIGTPFLTFTPPVNVLVGDLVHITLNTQCIRDGVDFYGNGGVRINSGTAVLESNGLSADGGMAYGVACLAIHGSQRINNVFSGIYEVSKAGTIATVSSSSFTTVGTNPTNQLTYLRVVIDRPNL